MGTRPGVGRTRSYVNTYLTMVDSARLAPTRGWDEPEDVENESVERFAFTIGSPPAVRPGVWQAAGARRDALPGPGNKGGRRDQTARRSAPDHAKANSEDSADPELLIDEVCIRVSCSTCRSARGYAWRWASSQSSGAHLDDIIPIGG